MLQEEEEETGEPGRIEIREKDRDAEELDFQHARIRKIENLDGLSKIQVLGFRYGTPYPFLRTAFLSVNQCRGWKKLP
jgi:hypothetical protein